MLDKNFVFKIVSNGWIVRAEWNYADEVYEIFEDPAMSLPTGNVTLMQAENKFASGEWILLEE